MSEDRTMLKKQMEQIIEKKKVYPVYQPIVSLKSGEILGYEALSRISLENCSFNVEEMFVYAEEFQCLWNLEYICRKKALKGAKNDLGKKKLFLNVDPNIFRDERFKAGMTLDYLKRYNISPDNIVFEVCERTDIREITPFQKTVNHYEKQHYEIAIDDFGKGHAHFTRIFFLHPKYVKIDMSLITDIDKDCVKNSYVEGLVKFCHSENISLIAEGIETKGELTALIRLGVDYGQGYFLGKPAEELKKIPQSLKDIIRENNLHTEIIPNTPVYSGNIGSISQRLDTTTYDTKALVVYEFMRKNPDVTELCVLDKDQKVCGLLTRQNVEECFGGMYGYTIYRKYSVGELLNQEYLEVDCRMPIEMVSRLALIRPKKRIYDAIIVSDNGTYVGIVTVKDLLQASVSIQIERAMDTNPLTHLPGNIQIENKISQNLFCKEKCSIMYLDLDNFKAYNDVYGFENGDMMIKAAAKCIEAACRNGEFIGHIGGDDFVIISNDYNLEDVFYQITDSFHQCLKKLYTQEDYTRGEYCSKNRHGEEEIFPLASLSGALYTNENISVQSMNDFSYKIALTKKESKQHAGDYLLKTEDIVF